jgi:tRNA G18 (ribose-2'-O)-methylase SpoU
LASKNRYRRNYAKDIIYSRHQPPGVFPVVLVLDHLKPTFNIGKIIRTANAFGVREIHLVGIPVFNPGPSKGTLRQTLTRSFETFIESHAWLRAEGYSIYALHPRGDGQLGQESLAERSAFVFGHEEHGLSFDPLHYPDIRTLRIAQFGQVESLNVSIAAGLASFEYLRQRGFAPPAPAFTPAPAIAALLPECPASPSPSR